MASKIEQSTCDYCGGLGELIAVDVIRNYPFTDVSAIKLRSRCQKCHSTFEERVPYLELKLLR